MRIDVHHHIAPPRYKEEAREAVIDSTEAHAPVFNWSPARSLEEMDKAGIDISLTSISMTRIWFGDNDKARALARSCNEFAAGFSADHPGRFGNLAVLPLPDVEGALREIEYAFDTLKADGVGMLTSYNSQWPSDPAFEPVFQELNRRKAVVHIHPITPVACRHLISGVADTLMEFLFDTTRAIVSLLFAGAYGKYPDIKFIFSHAGGAMPSLLDRIERRVVRSDELKALIPDGPTATLARLYYDTGTSSGETNLGNLLKFVPPSQILLGTDMPFVIPSISMDGLPHLFPDPAALEGVYSGNALRLFPRFAKA